VFSRQRPAGVDARLHATVALIPSIRGNHRMDYPLYPPSALEFARTGRELAPTQRSAIRAHAVTAR
jgi:hypothetical protein